MTDWIVALILYLYALALTGIKAWRIKLITDPSVEGDREREFHVFEDILAGSWGTIKQHEAVSSSITVTFFPYLLHWLTDWNAEWVFKLFPCPIYSLTPVFIYLIARHVLDTGYSAMAAFYVLSTFFFVKYNTIGRCGVALGFMSGAVYSLLMGNMVWASVLTLLVVISHYGVTYFFLYTLMATLAVLLMTTLGLSPEILRVAFLTIVLGAGILIYYRLIFRHVGDVMQSFIKASVTLSSATLDAPVYRAVAGGKIEHWGKLGIPPEKGKLHALFEVEHRDPLVQVAFGRTWQYLGKLQKTEFFLSWLFVILLMAGLVLSILWQGWTLWTALAVAFFSAFFISVANPHVSIYFGVGRAYLISLVLLAPYMIVGMDALTYLLHVNGYVMGFGLVVLYGLCVSLKFWGK